MLDVKIQLPPKPRIRNTFKGKLDENQSTILNFLISNFYFPANIKNGKASTTLQLTAGYGKTFIGIGLISKLQTRTLVIVPANSDLASQWVGCCSEYLSGSAVLYNNRKNEIADTTIIMISTAIKKPAEWFKQFGLVIYDEIHMYCSPVWGDIFWRTNVRCVLGLTATPLSQPSRVWPPPELQKRPRRSSTCQTERFPERLSIRVHGPPGTRRFVPGNKERHHPRSS